jgi:hypothetical protein
MRNQVCGGTLAPKPGGAAISPMLDTAVLRVDWYLSMTRIFQANTLDHHA